MRILFCDDDQLIIEQLQKYVLDFFKSMGGLIPDFAVYNSGDKLIQHETVADIAFLDVEMPGISGIHVGAKLKNYNPKIKIFIVTSYPDYLDEAMRFQVFRYLSKPIDKNRLFRNLKDALYQHNLETREYAISTNDGVFTKRAEDIICIEAAQRKVLVHTSTGILISTHTMDYWKQMLTLPCFFSTHRSFIINMRFVSSIGKDKILLKSGSILKEAYLTKRKYTLFKDTYLMYLESVQ